MKLIKEREDRCGSYFYLVEIGMEMGVDVINKTKDQQILARKMEYY